MIFLIALKRFAALQWRGGLRCPLLGAAQAARGAQAAIFVFRVHIISY
jgi:hypothetical protein